MSTSADRDTGRARKRPKVPAKALATRADTGHGGKTARETEAVYVSGKLAKAASKGKDARAMLASGKLARPKVFGRVDAAETVSGLKGQLEAALEGQPDAALIELVSVALTHASDPVRALKAPIEGALRAAALSPKIQEELLSSLVRLGNDEVTQARLAGEAKYSLLAGQKSLDAAEVSKLLGSNSENPRQFANTKRKRGEILGVPMANYFVYPEFQFDRPRHKVYPEIAAINALLNAKDDPFGVLSWWVSPNARLEDAQAPYQLLGTDQAEWLQSLAEAVVEPVG